MFPAISLIVFVTGVVFLRIVLYIFDFYKKIASIPTAPGRSWFVGHILELYRITNLEKCSWLCAAYFFINRVCDSNRRTFIDNGIDIGAYKVYLGSVPVVIITSPEAAENVYKTTDVHKPFVYQFAHTFGKGLPNLNGEEYKYHKKVTLSYFRNINSTIDRVNKHFHRFTESIGEDGIMRDLFATASSVGDAISSDVLTKQSVFLDQQNLRFENLKIVLDFFVSTTHKPWLMHKWLLPFSREGRQGLQYFKKNHFFEKFTEQAIKDFDSGDGVVENGQPTLMNLLIREHLKNPHVFTKENVLGELAWFWVGAFDTTALVLTYLILEVGNRPDIQDKIFDELSSVLSPGQELTIDVMDKLPYLEAVVKESMRRHPPGTLLPKHAVEDIKIPRINGEGFATIPKGTLIFISTHAVNNNPRHWKEPEEFNPDRFLSEKHLASDHPYAHLTFSAGKRGCPGKKMGYLTLKTMLAKLVQTYHIQSLNHLGSTPKVYKVVLCPIEAVSVKFIKRK